MAKLKDLIQQHLTYYKDYEKNDFDRARSFYRGDFYETFEFRTVLPWFAPVLPTWKS